MNGWVAFAFLLGWVAWSELRYLDARQQLRRARRGHDRGTAHWQSRHDQARDELASVRRARTP